MEEGGLFESDKSMENDLCLEDTYTLRHAGSQQWPLGESAWGIPGAIR